MPKVTLQPATLKDVQSEMLYLLKIVDKVCRENNIQYWLDCGTLLGSVRHNGFIPWDDDLDISVPSWDYHKLLSLLNKESKKNTHIFLFYFNKPETFWSDYLGSTKIISENNKACKIDIFPMKFIDKNQEDKDQKITNIANYFILGKINNTSSVPKRYTEGNLKESLKKKKDFMNYFNNIYIPSCIKKNKDSIAIYSFGKNNNPKQKYYCFSDIFPLQEVQFEDAIFFAPKNISIHLSKNYSNYMILPKKEQQHPSSFQYYFTEVEKSTIDLTYHGIKRYNSYFYFQKKNWLRKIFQKYNFYKKFQSLNRKRLAKRRSKKYQNISY